MRLALARGYDPIWVDLLTHLAMLPPAAFRQVQLVYNIATRRNHWHITIEGGIVPAVYEARKNMAVDLGEIHPALTQVRIPALELLIADRRGKTPPAFYAGERQRT